MSRGSPCPSRAMAGNGPPSSSTQKRSRNFCCSACGEVPQRLAAGLAVGVEQLGRFHGCLVRVALHLGQGDRAVGLASVAELHGVPGILPALVAQAVAGGVLVAEEPAVRASGRARWRPAAIPRPVPRSAAGPDAASSVRLRHSSPAGTATAGWNPRRRSTPAAGAGPRFPAPAPWTAARAGSCRAPPRPSGSCRRALELRQGAQRAGGQPGVEGQQQPCRPQRVPAEQREVPGRPGGDERGVGQLPGGQAQAVQFIERVLQQRPSGAGGRRGPASGGGAAATTASPCPPARPAIRLRTGVPGRRCRATRQPFAGGNAAGGRRPAGSGRRRASAAWNRPPRRLGGSRKRLSRIAAMSVKSAASSIRVPRRAPPGTCPPCSECRTTPGVTVQVWRSSTAGSAVWPRDAPDESPDPQDAAGPASTVAVPVPAVDRDGPGTACGCRRAGGP